MFIRKLELSNFQKHAKLELNFTNGVNIIHGKTDIGKSCIIRAIRWCFFGEPKGDVIRKEETKKTSVKIIKDDGITIERIKSDSVNAYILNVENGKKEDEKRFDAVGKTIPKEVRKALGIDTLKIDKEELILNIANQIELPFLLDKSGTFRMKLFNKLTGCEIIDKVYQELNKDILHSNKVEKLEKEHLEEQQKLLEKLIIEKENKEKTYKPLLKIYEELKTKMEFYEKLKKWSLTLEENKVEINLTKENLEKIKTIDEKELLFLKQSIDKLERLKELQRKSEENKKELEIVTAKLTTIKIPEINIKELQEKIDKLDRLDNYVIHLKNTKISKEKLTDNIKTITEQIKEDNEKYQELLKECKICPTCKTKITDDIVKEIKL